MLRPLNEFSQHKFDYKFDVEWAGRGIPASSSCQYLKERRPEEFAPKLANNGLNLSLANWNLANPADSGLTSGCWTGAGSCH